MTCVQCAFQQRPVRAGVDQKHDALRGHDLKHGLQLDDAAAVAFGKTAQVHQAKVTRVHQRPHRSLPGVVAADHIVDPEAAVPVGQQMDIGDASWQVLRFDDELAAQPSADEIHELVRVDRACRHIGRNAGTELASVGTASFMAGGGSGTEWALAAARIQRAIRQR